MLTEGRVLVDGEPVYKAKKLLAKGNLVSVINRSEAMIKSPPPEARKQFSKLKIIFEDEFLVVDKPALTEKLEKDTLHSRCVDHVKRQSERAWCHIVHRLDRDTSGVMVFAKNREKNICKHNLQSVMSSACTMRWLRVGLNKMMGRILPGSLKISTYMLSVSNEADV